MSIIKKAGLAMMIALAMTSTFALADSDQPNEKPVKRTTDLYIEGGVDRTKMTDSWKKAHENDVIGMANPSAINSGGQGYPDLRK